MRPYGNSSTPYQRLKGSTSQSRYRCCFLFCCVKPNILSELDEDRERDGEEGDSKEVVPELKEFQPRPGDLGTQKQQPLEPIALDLVRRGNGPKPAESPYYSNNRFVPPSVGPTNS